MRWLNSWIKMQTNIFLWLVSISSFNLRIINFLRQLNSKIVNISINLVYNKKRFFRIKSVSQKLLRQLLRIHQRFFLSWNFSSKITFIIWNRNINIQPILFLKKQISIKNRFMPNMNCSRRIKSWKDCTLFSFLQSKKKLIKIPMRINNSFFKSIKIWFILKFWHSFSSKSLNQIFIF